RWLSCEGVLGGHALWRGADAGAHVTGSRPAARSTSSASRYGWHGHGPQPGAMHCRSWVRVGTCAS
ncbi:MAG: hypothetical protein ACRDT8_12735, partial [Micromonosporaceae bacterium]